MTSHLQHPDQSHLDLSSCETLKSMYKLLLLHFMQVSNCSSVISRN